MIELTDQILIFISCSILFILNFHNVYHVTIFCSAMILCSLLILFDYKWARFFLFGIYITLSMIFRDFLYFFPIMMYHPIQYPYRYLSLLMIFSFLRYFTTFSVATLLAIGMLTTISIYFGIRTMQLKKLKTEYYNMRDSSHELYLIQEEKNRHVLENQDYEINLAMLGERNRISKEIHDNIGHLLSRSLLQIGALLTVTQEETTREVLSDLKVSISDGMDSIRASIHNLHDTSIDLYSSLYTSIKDFTFCHVQFDYDIDTSPPMKVTYCILFIVKEALANIMKHSNATELTIILREHPGLYQLIIKDNGTIPSSTRYKINQYLTPNGYHDGMGLQNIIDRVKGLSGNIAFHFDHGFEIFITIPR